MSDYSEKHIRQRVLEINKYFGEKYQYDNIDIVNERFSMTLQFVSEIPFLLESAKNLKGAAILEQMNAGKKRLEAEAFEYKLSALVESVEKTATTLDKAHRTLQSQFSELKEEKIKNNLK